jgi:hypothetical protein
MMTSSLRALVRPSPSLFSNNMITSFLYPPVLAYSLFSLEFFFPPCTILLSSPLSVTHPQKWQHKKSRFLAATRAQKDKVFEARASLTQDFAPLKSVCAHLNELHIYASSVREAGVEAIGDIRDGVGAAGRGEAGGEEARI